MSWNPDTEYEQASPFSDYAPVRRPAPVDVTGTLAVPAGNTIGTWVVCICGSTRFMPQMTLAAQRETLAGHVVVRPEIDMKAPDPAWNVSDVDQVKTMLDELHRAKIRLADEVLIVCPGGYMGQSTQSELAYALELGKPVRTWPDDVQPVRGAGDTLSRPAL